MSVLVLSNSGSHTQTTNQLANRPSTHPDSLLITSQPTASCQMSAWCLKKSACMGPSVEPPSPHVGLHMIPYYSTWHTNERHTQDTIARKQQPPVKNSGKDVKMRKSQSFHFYPEYLGGGTRRQPYLDQLTSTSLANHGSGGR